MTNQMTQADNLEIWLVLDLLKHDQTNPKLIEKARDLAFRLRQENKLNGSK